MYEYFIVILCIAISILIGIYTSNVLNRKKEDVEFSLALFERKLSLYIKKINELDQINNAMEIQTKKSIAIIKTTKIKIERNQYGR